jgi:hypothetical protein
MAANAATGRMYGVNDLDAVTLKAADRVRNGLPVVFHAETFYGHERRDEGIVCVPVRLRTRKPVSFAGLCKEW